MYFILIIVVATIWYFICQWLGNKAIEWAARDPDKLIDSNRRLKDLAFFAVIGFSLSLIQIVTWAMQGVAWAVNLFV